MSAKVLELERLIRGDIDAGLKQRYGPDNGIAWFLKNGGQFYEDIFLHKYRETAVYGFMELDGKEFVCSCEPVHGVLNRDEWALLLFLLHIDLPG